MERGDAAGIFTDPSNFDTMNARPLRATGASILTRTLEPMGPEDAADRVAVETMPGSGA